MVTGCAEIGELQRAINIGGIASYVQKPWNDDELRRLTLDCIARFNLIEEKAFIVSQLSSSDGPLAELLDGNQVPGLAQRQETHDVISALLREKELMMQEIHHRVKNNMQVISSLLSLQLSKITDRSTRRIFDVSIQRIRSMALVHQALYHSNDLGSIDFTDYVRTLVSGIARSLKVETVTWRVDGAPVLVGIDTAIPLGLIVNELVSNAFVHGFPRSLSGDILVTLRQDQNNHLTVVVKDSGRGVPEGMDIHRVQTLGLGLVATLVEQLDGRVDIKKNDGTECTVIISPTSSGHDRIQLAHRAS